MMDITQLIADKLDSLYPDIPIYRENIDGDFSEPSFFIQRVNMTPTPRLFNFQKQNYRYNVVYFPPKDNPKEDCDNMTENLANDFRSIDGVAQLFEREFEVLESDPPNAELHFSFRLELHVKPDEADKFNQDLAINTKTKEGQNETN